MLHAWRIVKAKHAANAFSGEGAKIAGGRWNSPGVAMVYTAGSHSLAILEMLVHLQSQDLLQRYVVFEVTFPEAIVTSIDRKDLPKAWNKFPAPQSVKNIGDSWIAEGASAVIRVPSVIVPSEYNFLINPHDRDFGRIRIGPRKSLKFDSRLTRN